MSPIFNFFKLLIEEEEDEENIQKMKEWWDEKLRNGKHEYYFHRYAVHNPKQTETPWAKLM
jgi:hypothetical protein